MSFARTVVETELVAARIDRVNLPTFRVRELYDALIWLLARCPTAGTLVPGTNPPHYIAKTFSWNPGRCPSIAVLYHFNDNEVVIVSSRIYEPKDRTRRA